jgi:hypothetical protein
MSLNNILVIRASVAINKYNYVQFMLISDYIGSDFKWLGQFSMLLVGTSGHNRQIWRRRDCNSGEEITVSKIVFDRNCLSWTRSFRQLWCFLQ